MNDNLCFLYTLPILLVLDLRLRQQVKFKDLKQAKLNSRHLTTTLTCCALPSYFLIPVFSAFYHVHDKSNMRSQQKSSRGLI